MGLILLGVLLTLITMVLVVRYQSASKSELTEEEKYRKFVVEHTAREQARLGIDCTKLQTQLANFIDARIGPVLVVCKPGRPWDTLVSEKLKEDVKSYAEFLFGCHRLYRMGKAGELNGLQALRYIEEAEKQYSTIAALLIYAESGEYCDHKCLDAKFGLLVESRDNLVRLLK